MRASRSELAPAGMLSMHAGTMPPHCAAAAASAASKWCMPSCRVCPVGAGMCAGTVGTATSNGLLALRKKLDPSYTSPVSCHLLPCFAINARGRNMR